MHWGNLFSATCNSATILSQSLCDTLSNNLAQAKVHRKGTLKCDQKVCCSGVCGFQDGTQTLEVGGGHRGGRRGTPLFSLTAGVYSWTRLSNGFKTESIQKLNNFNFPWTKTFYQNNLNNIAFFFYIIFEGLYRYNKYYLSVITPKTISHGNPRKQMTNFRRMVKTQLKFWKFHVWCHFVK